MGTFGLKKLKISRIFCSKRHIPITVINIVLYYEQFCRAPTSANDGIFLYYFATLISERFSTKLCLRFHRWCFFSSEKELFSWTYLLKKTPRRTKILISPVWNKILKIWDTLFKFMQIEVKCVKNYFKIFLPQEAGAFGNNIE